MSGVLEIDTLRAKKRAEELTKFILELDNICETLYHRLEHVGVWQALMRLEDVRIRYYIECYEIKQLLIEKGLKDV